jgi:hypothetical protein
MTCFDLQDIQDGLNLIDSDSSGLHMEAAQRAKMNEYLWKELMKEYLQHANAYRVRQSQSSVFSSFIAVQLQADAKDA